MAIETAATLQGLIPWSAFHDGLVRARDAWISANGYQSPALELFDSAQKEEQRLWLDDRLKRFETLYRGFGPLGQRLVDIFNATGCTHGIDLTLKSRAALQPYNVNLGFLNRIDLGQKALQDDNDASFAECDMHERIHAIQFAGVPVVHATPFNYATKRILCPEDAILLEELKERIAYSVSKFLSDPLRSGKPLISDEEKIGAQISLDAETVLESMLNEDSETYLSHYRSEALDAYCTLPTNPYAAPMSWRIEHNQEQDIEFVRLDEASLEPLLKPLGIQVFPGLARSLLDRRVGSPLSPDERKRLDDTNRRLNVPEKMRTFSQALRDDNETAADFMARSRAYKPGANFELKVA